MKILHLLPTLDPKAGGPTEGVRQSGLELIAMGHQVEVASLDAPDAPYVADFPLPVTALGPGNSTYGYTPRLVPWLRENAPRFDAAVVNGLWQYQSYGAWKALHDLDVPYYVFPHGMLDPWFKRTYPLKHLKKWLYWPWAEYRVLRDARAVLFTAEEERIQARQSFWLYRASERVVSFGTASPPADAERLRERFWAAFPALKHRRVLLFLGRIHPKKGCDLLIRAFAKTASLDAGAHLVIAGPDSVGWSAELKTLAGELGIASRITWPGMLQGELKWGAFHASDAFLLPSHQENFGIAVAEALGCRVPVLISDKVNIWREVAEGGAGLVAADTVQGTEETLRCWLSLDAAARETMRVQAAATFKARFTVAAMARDLIEVLQGDVLSAQAGDHAPSLGAVSASKS
ncbi:glycosyltransferase [Trinickia violacea]|uniref:Glycosyltransferase n=1 Tax=Trinickia violacea TaxID=2571746 RepID=A0A4V1EHN2_9BURK|nr:glycosyltransferase [Trinickia violacea]QCP50860.1 glycosyltransferase [Trinickia violacea]